MSESLWNVLKEHFTNIIKYPPSKKCLEFSANLLCTIEGNESFTEKVEKSVNFSHTEHIKKPKKKKKFQSKINKNLIDIVLQILNHKDIKKDCNYIEFYCQIANNFLYYDVLKEICNGQDLNVIFCEENILPLFGHQVNQSVISLFFANLQHVPNNRKLKLIESAFIVSLLAPYK